MNSHPKALKLLARRKTQITVFGLLSLGCMIVTAFLAVQVFVKLDRYGSTAIDNIQWTMSQLEVEQIKLASALERLQDPTDENIKNARERFDILFSRANAMKTGLAYRAVLSGTAADQHLAIIFTELENMAELVDRADQAFVDARETLAEATLSLTPAIRRLSSEGIAIGAKTAQAERGSLTSSLWQITVMSLLMVTAMLSLMWLLWRLYLLYRKRALQNRITLNRLSTILNTSEDAILVVGPDGAIVETNDAARAMFGPFNTGSETRRICGVLWRRDADGGLSPITGDSLRTSFQDATDGSAGLVARRQEGTLVPVELSANLASRSGDEVCICFIRDISDRLAAEAEVQAARDKALSSERARAQFLGRISHEMRTPLHGLLGTLDLLDSTDLSPEQARYADIMKSSGQVLLNQIDDALDITRSGSGSPRLVETVFDVERLIEDIATSQRSVAEANGNRIDLRSQDVPVGSVLGDRDRVHQIVLNLLSNAIKFTQNGRISIEAAWVGSPGKLENILEIQVSDTGIGIAADNVDRIFNDFVRVTSPNGQKIEGTGLGLGIARNLATLMGGDIGVESLLGEGSVFWIRLPLRKATDCGVSETVPSDLPAAHTADSLEILIIEDNPTNRIVLQVMLEKQGHSVTHAVDGETGVALAEATAFDLIVMDVNMPGMDGIEATRCIREGTGASATARIVALSAYIDANTRKILKNSGVDDVRIKPLRMAELDSLLIARRRKPAISRSETLDHAITEQLKSILSKDRFNNLIQSLTEESSSILDALDHMDKADPDVLAMQLHQVAGVAATVGAIAVRDALCRAEAAARAGNKRKLKKELQVFSKAWEDTLRQLHVQDRAA